MQTVRTVRAPIQLPQILTEVLPRHLCDAVSRCGALQIEELRLHSERVVTVTSEGRNLPLGVILRADEMNGILKRMCGNSLYAYNRTIAQGYLTLEGGIRVGVCGCAACEDGRIIGVNDVSGLILRIPNRPTVNVAPILSLLRESDCLRGVLIYSPPGVGKTTVLRATATEAARGITALRTVVVDTREELRYALSGEDLTLDVLVGYPRDLGIEIAVRSLGAQLVVCDEIGNVADALAVVHAANCGVPLLASAHASNVSELLLRPALRALHRARVFSAYVGLSRRGRHEMTYHICRWEEVPNDSAR